VDEVEKVKALAPLTDADIARATGSSAGTVAAWRAHRQIPRGARAPRLVELSALVERLAGIVAADYIPVWLNKTVPRLEHRVPADVLAAAATSECRARSASSSTRPSAERAAGRRTAAALVWTFGFPYNDRR
jgi:hypothetical protein